MGLLKAVEASRTSKENSQKLHNELLANEDETLLKVTESINLAIEKGLRGCDLQLTNKELDKISPILTNLGYSVYSNPIFKDGTLEVAVRF